MAASGVQPLVPRPPSVSSDAAPAASLVPKAPSDSRVAASRRALSVLLRQVDQSASMADSSEGDLQRAPRRSNRSRGLLKEVYSIQSLDELLVRESQLRMVITSNEVRQRASIKTLKYDADVVHEEQQIVKDREALNRSVVVDAEAHHRQAHLGLLQVVVGECCARHCIARAYPPQSIVHGITDIRLRLLRKYETDARRYCIEACEAAEFLECFDRYLIASDYVRENVSVRSLVRQQMSCQEEYLSHRREERVMLEMQEYVERDALDGQMHAALSSAIATALRERRFLAHNDVQTIEAHRRTVLQRLEGGEFSLLLVRFVQQKRCLVGDTLLSNLGTEEFRWRRELELDEAHAYRLLSTQALRAWHATHQHILALRDNFSVVTHAEALRRSDVETEYRSELLRLSHLSRASHTRVSHRDWERRHLLDTFIDGRIALWRQQDAVVDTLYQDYQQRGRLLQLQSASSVVSREEEAKREALMVDQWKVFMLFYLWSAVQRFKSQAVSQAYAIEQQESSARTRMMNDFCEELHRISTVPTWALVHNEDALRLEYEEQQLDERLRIYQYFKEGRRDLVRATVEVGSLLISCVEHSERQRISLVETSRRFDIKGCVYKDLARLEKSELAKIEALERRIIYARILACVEDWFRADLEYDEAEAHEELVKLSSSELQLLLEAQQRRLEELRRQEAFPDSRVLALQLIEMEQRSLIIHDATVSANAAMTNYWCHNPMRHLRFVSYDMSLLLHEMRLFDPEQFLADVVQEIRLLKTLDEPHQRRVVVVAEHELRELMLCAHHEAVERSAISKNEARELAAVLDTVHRVVQRDTSFTQVAAMRVLDDRAAVARNASEVQCRAELLDLLERQEEEYREAERAIKLRMLLDEGPLLRAFFALADEISAAEDISRDALRADMLTERVILLAAAEHAKDGDLTCADADACSPSRGDEFGAGDQSILSAAPSPYRPRPTFAYDLSLHSIQVSLMHHWVLGCSDEQPLVTMYVTVDNGDSARRHLMPIVESQRVTIGSKTLVVVQPAEEASSKWELGAALTVSVEVFAKDTLVLYADRTFSVYETENNKATEQSGIVTLPLQAAEAGASGKVNFVIDVQ